MPKKTFMNLPNEKKDKIINTAIDEFAEYTYLNASINRIVENSDIAKGSFYQYFEDKKDLYKYILEVAWERKSKALSNALKKINEIEFFEILREIYITEVKFMNDFPKLSSIINDFDKNHSSEMGKDKTDSDLISNRIYENLVIDGIDNGDIDKNIDVKFTAFLMNSYNIIIKEYLSNESKQASYIEITDLIDKCIDYIKNGVKIKKRIVKNVEDRFY